MEEENEITRPEAEPGLGRHGLGVISSHPFGITLKAGLDDGSKARSQLII